MPYEEDKPGKPGAPIKWSLDLQAEICQVLEGGSFLGPACEAVGLHPRTYQRWMKGDKPHHRLFQAAVRKATAGCEVKGATKLYVAGQEDPEMLLKFMRARFNERWGETKQITVAVDKELEAALDKLQGRLTPEEFERVVSIIATEEAGTEASGSDTGDQED